MSDPGLGVRTAQAVGITGSAFISGGVTVMSTIVIPSLLIPLQQGQRQGQEENNNPKSSPSLSTQVAAQWLTVYKRGKQTFPALAGIASVAYGYLIRSSLAVGGGGIQHCYYYLGALGLTLGIVPFTYFMMAGVNKTIGSYAAEDTNSSNNLKDSAGDEKKREVELECLLKKWAVFNLFRAVPLLGSVLGFYAAVAV